MIKLFVFGIPDGTEVISLIELFTLYGMVHSVYIASDKVTGKMLNYGFIEITDQAGADRAITALDGIEFKGSKLTVRVAEKKNFTTNKSKDTSKALNRHVTKQPKVKSKRPRLVK